MVIGGHSHTRLEEAIIVDGRTPVVQAGKESENLGELVVTLEWRKADRSSRTACTRSTTPSWARVVADEIERLGKRVTRASSPRAATASTSRSRSCPGISRTRSPTSRQHPPRQPRHRRLPARRPRPTSGSRPTGCCAPASGEGSRACRRSTTSSPWRRWAPASWTRTAGSALVTGYFTGRELKNLLEFFLVDNPVHPGEYFPRASGMRFRYDPVRARSSMP